MQDMHKYKEVLKSISELKNIVEKNKSIKDRYKEGKVFNFDYLDYTFEIYFSDYFPLDIPKITKVRGPFHCHIDITGTVCLVNQEDVYYDIEDEEALILKTINALKKLLSMPSKECEEEIKIEYNDYLNFFDNFKENRCFLFEDVDKGQMFQKNETFFIGKNGIFADEICKEDHSITLFNYIKLKLDRVIPIEQKKLTTNDFFDCLCSESKAVLLNYKNRSNNQYYVLEYHSSIDTINYLLLNIHKNGNISFDNAFLDPTSDVTLYGVSNCNIDFLKKRGGCILTDKKILVIGVGSVGSEIVNQLVSSGFDNIDIVDNDILKMENGFRISAGFATLKDFYHIYHKADILRSFFKNKYPNMKCNMYNEDIIHLIKNDRIQLDEYDYIISSIGNAVINSYINELLYKRGYSKKAIYAWLEPYGIAEHILCVDTKKKGCFACYLKSSSSINMVAGDENYKIRNNVCSGSYTPYGKSSCCRLAANVTEIISLDCANVSEMINKHIVRKGPVDYFLKKGFKKTKSMQLSQDQIDDLSRDFIYEGCNVCGHCND